MDIDQCWSDCAEATSEIWISSLCSGPGIKEFMSKTKYEIAKHYSRRMSELRFIGELNLRANPPHPMEMKKQENVCFTQKVSFLSAHSSQIMSRRWLEFRVLTTRFCSNSHPQPVAQCQRRIACSLLLPCPSRRQHSQSSPASETKNRLLPFNLCRAS